MPIPRFTRLFRPLPAAIALLCLPLSPAARAFYLAPGGSDNAAGTSAAPWGGLAKANAALSAGDTLFLKNGTYAGSGITWTRSGTAEKPIVIRAAAGATPIFDGKGADWLLLINAKYLSFEGMELTGYGSWGFQVADNSDHVSIRQCHLHHILAADNAAIVTRNCGDILIEGCLFEAMGRGLDKTAYDHAVYNSEGSHDIIIRSNTFRDNFAGPAINNYHEPSPHHVFIYNNLFVMTKGAERSGIYAGTGAHDIFVYNNTFYAEAAGSVKCYAVTLNAGAGTNAVVNNIFYSEGGGEALIGATGDQVDYNAYFPERDAEDKGGHSYAADPVFVTTGKDFHLTPLSPACNRGFPLPLFATDMEGKPRPTSVWDLGAYQIGDGTALRYTGRVNGRRDPVGADAAGIYYGRDARGARVPIKASLPPGTFPGANPSAIRLWRCFPAGD